AAVPVTIKNGGRFAFRGFRQQQIAGDGRASLVVEFEFFEGVVAAIFVREGFDCRKLWTRGEFAEQLGGGGADLEALFFPAGFGWRRIEDRNGWGFGEPASGI